MTPADLPSGSAPPPVPLPHFPDRLHAFLWRNWSLVPIQRIAEVVGASPEAVLRLGESMGLPEPPRITADFQKRSYLTVIRRNWHLLPYEELLQLLGWTADEMAYALQEDDFLYVKLGRLKPRCEPLRYEEPGAAARARAAEIAGTVRDCFGRGRAEEPLFRFVEELSRPPEGDPPPPAGPNVFSPRYCYSYFALYGDPLLDPDADPFPDGYLERLARSGVSGVWLQGVLYKLSPFPWDLFLSERWEERLENLRALAARAAKHGIGIWLYLNEPRSMPHAFFEERPELKGTPEAEYAALCTSVPEVRDYLTGAVAAVSRAVPELAGFFTITASENLTNCWSRMRGHECPRCAERDPAEVIAEVNRAVAAGVREVGAGAQFIAWDWGWKDEWAEGIIRGLPQDAALMSVSEWSLPITRGGVEAVVGEYSISAVGPGPRASRHWALARERGLKTMAKIQANVTWELSAVPYIPAVANVARHVANLREAGVDGLMLGWTLGGYPSPNLEVVAELGSDPDAAPEEAMLRVAERRYGAGAAPAVVRFWQELSAAFSEFPYHIGTVYTAPLQHGPANLLWGEPTGYKATMIGFPYDDLDTWRAVYPPLVFADQLTTVSAGFTRALKELRSALAEVQDLSDAERERLNGEEWVAFSALLHFQSAGQQAAFVRARQLLAEAADPAEAGTLLDDLETLLNQESEVARMLHQFQSGDSRIGFEASNQYYYVPLDLIEKVLNCRWLLEHWLPAQRARWELAEGD